ncbi:hypothetical protein ACTU6V_12690 [Microbacterium sp. A204]|uniref:hypothetical protein n=1 Tax=Microbacterium sp. A204 TaxID=3457321 RepID=UPI003FD615B7
MSHDEADGRGVDPGAGARSVRRSDRRHDSPEVDEGRAQLEDIEASRHEILEEADADQDSEEFTQVVEIARSFSGPLPHEQTLSAYNSIVPGSAKKIIDGHLYGEKAAADALTRLTTAESSAVMIGAVGAQLLTIGGLVAAVVLIVTGFPLASIAGIIPAILGASAQVIAATRKRD